jgi:cysteine desulfurase
MKVYFDNAATTRLDEEVLKCMMPYFTDDFGNPSSIHEYGRKTRAVIEQARKSVARHLNVTPAEIFFTSGGTEADNMAIVQCIESHGIKHAISSPIEHHAVEHTLRELEKAGKIKVSWVRVDGKGHVDLGHLEELLKANPGSFVSLMHANNEIGTLLPIERVGELCAAHNAIFHSDTVQTMGHYRLDLRRAGVHFATCAAHKFHGPKGTGFLFIRNDIKIKPFINGGSQERNMRGGTENVAGIVGLAKAFDIAHDEMFSHHKHILGIKHYMMSALRAAIPGVSFNGETDDDKSLYTVLNCCFPSHADGEMLLFNLDIMGVAASGGSACSSGSNQGSHVLRAIGSDMTRPSVRFSFSKYSKVEEVDFAVSKLAAIFAVKEKVTH